MNQDNITIAIFRNINIIYSKILNVLIYRPSEHSNSYEDLTEPLEMSTTTETTAFATGSRPKFTRQQSTMETPLDSSGVVKMTCWF